MPAVRDFKHRSKTGALSLRHAAAVADWALDRRPFAGECRAEVAAAWDRLNQFSICDGSSLEERMEYLERLLLNPEFSAVVVDTAAFYLESDLSPEDRRREAKAPWNSCWAHHACRRYQQSGGFTRDLQLLYDILSLHQEESLAFGVVPSDDVVILDFDLEGGYEQWCQQYGLSESFTFTTKTPRGRHVYLRGARDLNLQFPPMHKVDIRTAGAKVGSRCYVVGPNQRLGGTYEYRATAAEWAGRSDLSPGWCQLADVNDLLHLGFAAAGEPVRTAPQRHLATPEEGDEVGQRPAHYQRRPGPRSAFSEGVDVLSLIEANLAHLVSDRFDTTNSADLFSVYNLCINLGMNEEQLIEFCWSHRKDVPSLAKLNLRDLGWLSQDVQRCYRKQRWATNEKRPGVDWDCEAFIRAYMQELNAGRSASRHRREPKHFATLRGIAQMAQSMGHQFYFSTRSLAKIVGKDHSTIARHLQRLEQEGYITKVIEHRFVGAEGSIAPTYVVNFHQPSFAPLHPREDEERAVTTSGERRGEGAHRPRFIDGYGRPGVPTPCSDRMPQWTLVAEPPSAVMWDHPWKNLGRPGYTWSSAKRFATQLKPVNLSWTPLPPAGGGRHPPGPSLMGPTETHRPRGPGSPTEPMT